MIKYLHPKLTNGLDLFRQLATLLATGITLPQSLTLLRQATENSFYSSLLQTLCTDIEAGQAFNQALQRFPQYFDPLTCRLVAIGEQSGTLEKMLKQIATYLEKKHHLQQQIKQALFYPLILFIAALVTSFILLFWIVPHFVELFEHFPHSLPLVTRSIILLSQLLHRPECIIIIILSMLAPVFIRKTQLIAIDWQAILLSTPCLGKIMKKILLAQFSQHLATMLAAALPLTEALILAAYLFPRTAFAESIQIAYTEIESGKSLAASLAAQPLFPALLVEMVELGEASGRLEIMLNRFSEIYEEDIQQSLRYFSHLLEPLIIAIVGVLIGGVVVAMYLPLFQLGTVI